MKIKSLQIQRMPGFEQVGLRLDNLCEGLNIIYGANGSGKTSTARAIRGLLWPQSLSKDCYNIIDSSWQTENGEFSLTVEGNSQRFSSETAAKLSATLPPDYIASCFTITVDDLFLESNGSEQVLFKELRKQLAGGFDICLLKSETEGSASERRIKNLITQINEVSKEIVRETENQRILERKQNDIKTYEKKLEQIKKVKGEIHKIQQLKELRQLQQRQKELMLKLSQFPEGMKYFHENDFQSFNDIKQKIQQLAAEILATQSEKENLSNQIASYPPAYRMVDEVAMLAQRERIKNLSELKLRYDESRFNKERLDGEITAIKTQGGWLENINVESIDVVRLQKVDELEHRNKIIQEKLDQINAHIEVIQEAGDNADEDLVTKGLKTLGEILQSLRLPFSSIFKAIKVLIIVLSILGMVIGAVVGSYFSWLAGGSVLVLSLIVAIWGHQHIHRKLLREQEVLINTYRSLGLALPGSWDIESIEVVIQGLEKQKAKIRLASIQAEEKKRLEIEKQQALTARQQLDQEKQDLLLQIGLTPDLPFARLSMILRDCYRAREISVSSLAEASRLALIASEIEKLAAELRTYLMQFEISNIQTINEICAAFELVSDRILEVKRVVAKVEEILHRLKVLANDLSEREAQRDAILKRLKLEMHQQERLLELMDSLPRYREVIEEYKYVELAIKDYGNKFEIAPGEDDSSQIDVLGHKLEELQIIVATEEEVIKELGSISALVEAAKRGHRIEEAYARRNQVEGKLQGEFEQYCFQLCLEYWQNVLEEIFIHDAQPDLVREASRLFSKFTNERFSMEIDTNREGSGFYARDRQTEKRLKLSELSRGTRMQLMIAIRLAFLEIEERGLKLPLILDEVLNSSDPERFAAIVKVIAEIIEDGRQVHYFTCLPADAEALERMVREQGLAVRRIELTKQVEPRIYDYKRSIEVLSPDGASLSDYLKKLNIAPVDLKLGKNALYLGYLCDSSESLYRLLASGIKTFGQFEGLVRGGGGGASVFVDDREKERIFAKAKVYEELQKGRSVGYGREISPELIREVCDGSDKVDELIEKAKELDWNATKFLVAIDPSQGRAVRRLKRNIFERMQERIEQEGLLSNDLPLTDEEIKGRVFAALSTEIHSGMISLEDVNDIIHKELNAPRR